MIVVVVVVVRAKWADAVAAAAAAAARRAGRMPITAHAALLSPRAVYRWRVAPLVCLEPNSVAKMRLHAPDPRDRLSVKHSGLLANGRRMRTAAIACQTVCPRAAY